MKNKMSIIWSGLFLIVGMIMIHCDESGSPENGGGSGIYGSWNWEKTAGGFAYREFVPPPKVTVTFEDNGTCDFYRNDTLISNRNFTLTREILFSPDTQNIITFSDSASDSTMDVKHFPGMGQKYYEITNSTMVIGDLGNDMFIYEYSRKK